MSFAAVFGILLGIVIVLGSIATGTENYTAFLHLQGFMIVVGGTMANAFMSYETRDVMKSLGAIIDMVKKPRAINEKLNRDVKQIVEWSFIVQPKGVIALEEAKRKIHDPILYYGMELVITDYRPEEIKTMMENAIESNYERHTFPATILKTMASTAPAFGMIGTLVGMVIMLGNLQSDISLIGGGMSIALLATLYGVLSARLLYLPAAERLIHNEEIMRFRYYLITEGLILLVERKGPRYVQDKLNSFIDPSIHFDLDRQGIKRYEFLPQKTY